MNQLQAGMLLLATPELMDPNFADTVVLLLDADDQGALGVVVNRPSPVLVADVLTDWRHIVTEPEVLFRGGPVSTDGAIAVALLHGTDRRPVGFRPVLGALGIIDLDTPVDGLGDTIADLRIFAGYAGWGAGQLEAEVAEGSWHVVAGLARDIFQGDPHDLLRQVLRRQPGELAWQSTRPVDADLN